ncbi:hypothetical protein F383_33767 [Gossypium arboreum]|uniref:Uncharacterized protein n=1 Tax=Gossypium arboreum TaxID=29729 RepID=A0A0B0N7F6_GOSAR|nr:hypothetical protein F383_33767 [Gossypium arboreum]
MAIHTRVLGHVPFRGVSHMAETQARVSARVDKNRSFAKPICHPSLIHTNQPKYTISIHL